MALISKWKYPSWVSIDTLLARLTKQAGGGDTWNAGAISRNFLSDLTNNAGVRWKATETNKARMCGLGGNFDANQSYEDIEFAWFAQAGGTLEIYEAGIQKVAGGAGLVYAANETLEVILEDLGDTTEFFENFDDNEINEDDWFILRPTDNTVITEEGGRLKIQPQTGATGYNELCGNARDFTGKAFVVDIVEHLYQSGYNDAGIKIWLDDANHILLFVSGGTGYARIYNANVQSQASFGYDTNQVSKMRIRHNPIDGKFYFDTYHNSEGWRNHVSYLPSWAVTNVEPRIWAGNWNAYYLIGTFRVDNARIESFAGSGFVVNYYQTPEGGARTLRYTSAKAESYLRSILPLRVDTSIYHEGGTIDSIETVGSGWNDESGVSNRVSSAGVPVAFQTIPQITPPAFGGGTGGGSEPPTTGQIFPRGLN